MVKITYPYLYEVASAASGRAQKIYLRLLLAEYSCLFVAAVLSYNFYADTMYYLICTIFLFAGAAILVCRSLYKPEQNWYRCRALTESVKTLTWCYVMRAEPFDARPGKESPQILFIESLRQILSINRGLGGAFAQNSQTQRQITDEMEDIRKFIFVERKKLYLSDRIQEQKTWYVNKANANRRNFFRYLVACVLVYALVILLSFLRVAYPSVQYSGIEPLIVLASSIIG